MLPKRFPDREEIAAVSAEAEKAEPGQTLEARHRVAGRVMARRDMGKLAFLDLVDRSGRIQLIAQESQGLDLGDIVGATGRPGRSKRGEPSLMVEELVLLAKIRRSLPDTFHGLTDVETRYRQRYLDLLVNEETRADFELRTRMVTAIRRYLDERGFLEVETPVLQPRYGGAFAEPFVTHYIELDADYYLRIATELYLKRLIVGGLERVYELGKDFRNEGVSYKHAPEFTMVEWYEAYADYRDTMNRIKELIPYVAEAVLGTTKVSFRGFDIDLRDDWEELSFIGTLESRGVWTRDENELRAKLIHQGVDTSKDTTWAQLIDHAFTHFVEPDLIKPTIVFDYPIELSPFARATDADPTIVERFEYFVGGMELGNAFTELNDSAKQAERFAQQAREAGGEPGDPDYVEALAYGMPPTGGLGLGIDRLAMVLSGRESIRDVILFPALAEPGEIIDLAVPDRWFYHPVGSLLPRDWWEQEVLPHVDELLQAWTSSPDPLALLRSEIDFLRTPPLGPRPPLWMDFKVPVRRSVARSLETWLGELRDVRPMLSRVRPEALTWAESEPMAYLPRGTLNGLALLSSLRHLEPRAALPIKRAFLKRGDVSPAEFADDREE